MRDYYITTDSNSDLPKEYIDKYNTTIIPQYYSFEDVIYGDELNMSPNEFYERMRKGALPQSQANNPDVIENKFRAILNKGADIIHIGFSSLLVCMMLGTIFCNICPLSEDLMGRSDKWTSPLLAIFFVISGAELELSVFADIAIVGIGVVYIIFRCLGKYFGSLISAKATKCAPQICKYLGITLFPQAGVALGMCAIVASSTDFGDQGTLIRNITLFAVLIYELFGPLMTRQALMSAGEIKPMSQEVKDRRKNKLEEVKKNK